MGSLFEEERKQAKSVIISTWREIAETYTVGWVKPLQEAERAYPHISESIASIRHWVSDDLPVVVYQTRESPPTDMVAAIPHTGGGNIPFNCRLVLSSELNRRQAKLLNDFAQAFWFLILSGFLPPPEQGNALEMKLVELTGLKLVSTREIDLFKLIVEETKAYPAFIALKDSSWHAGARQLMNVLYSHMGDPNGNFVRDFQSNSFHSRLFEIACYAYLESHGFVIDRAFERPDFLVSKGNDRVAVEAVTANPSSGPGADISLCQMSQLPFEEMYKKCTDEFPIRMGNALLRKLRKQYWSLPHCTNIPFVLIVGPFHEPGSVFYIDESLARYLYGGFDIFSDWVKHKDLFVRMAPITVHQYGEKSITSNFFAQPLSKHVSAVIYCNAFTVPKFVRMAIQMGLESQTRAIREGVCLLPGEDGDIEYLDFKYDVMDPSAPLETWSQGVTVFHNPNALVPLPDDFFTATSVYRSRNGNLSREVHDFHPLVSFTMMSSLTETKE